MTPNGQGYLLDLVEADLLDTFSLKLAKDEFQAAGNVLVLMDGKKKTWILKKENL